MKRFKIRFPAPYNSFNVESIYDDNFDINVITEDGRVFFATLFTPKNVEKLMSRNKTIYFWATDMIFVKDLCKLTIREAVSNIIKDGYLECSFSEIGTIETVYANSIIRSFDDLLDMTHER